MNWCTKQQYAELVNKIMGKKFGDKLPMSELQKVVDYAKSADFEKEVIKNFLDKFVLPKVKGHPQFESISNDGDLRFKSQKTDRTFLIGVKFPFSSLNALEYWDNKDKLYEYLERNKEGYSEHNWFGANDLEEIINDAESCMVKQEGLEEFDKEITEMTVDEITKALDHDKIKELQSDYMKALRSEGEDTEYFAGQADIQGVVKYLRSVSKNETIKKVIEYLSNSEKDTFELMEKLAYYSDTENLEQNFIFEDIISDLKR